jgi:hypothetical protein
MMKKRQIFISALLVFGMMAPLLSQNRMVHLDRGRLWHSFHYAQECEPLADWRTMSYGLDSPGYNITEMSSNIGGTYSHMIAGGFFLSALRTIDPDTVQGWMDFALNGDRNTSWDSGMQPFIAKKHEKVWKKGENYYLAADPNEAEDVIISVWEKDPQYSDYSTSNKKFNVQVTRTVRQWSGSQADEDYVIVDYSIKSLRTELYGLDSAVLLFTYAMGPTPRAWNYTNPNYLSGARNTQSRHLPDKKLVTFWAGDYRNTIEDESFGYYEYYSYNPMTGENELRQEYMAPAKAALKILDIKLNNQPLDYQFVWCAGQESSDYEGPFSGVAGFENKYDAMKNPMLLYRAFTDTNSAFMGDSRLYAVFAIGPFNLRGMGRGELKVTIAEMVGGIDYAKARSYTLADKAKVAAAADSAIAYLSERVEFNYQNQYRVPMPPPGPVFDVSALDSSGIVANLITFNDSAEYIPDPHQGSPDLAGYRIYRSAQYPFGPWEKIADIPKKDTRFWNADNQRYEYKDFRVALGYGYYYSVTSYDSGHDAWAVNPAVSVPPLESSIYANRAKTRFYTTLKPMPADYDLSKIAVVPNPFYVSSGLDNVGDRKMIQFVNLPAECTIRIFTLRGDLVKTIHHNNPSSGVAKWNQISEYGQYVKSGMYFYKVESNKYEHTGKFAIIN